MPNSTARGALLRGRIYDISLRRLIQVVFGVLLLFATITAVMIIVAVYSRRTLVESQRTRLVSYQLADELRQSSDDLTRFARTYVTTGDPKFEQYYRDVLAIRNGNKPRPANYERVYWDFVADSGKAPTADGAAMPLREVMRRAGFTEAELGTLLQSEATSNTLVEIEETAIHAMKGEYRDAAGAFTRKAPPDQALAIRLMHDAAYHHEKAQVMAPIDEFLALVETRTTAELEGFNRQTAFFFPIIEGVMVLFVGVVVAAYPVLKRRVLVPVSVLHRQTSSVAADLERLASVTTQIGRGDLSQSFTVSAAPIRTTRKDEIGDLARVHDSMIEQLQAGGSAIAAITVELSQARHRLEEILNKTPVAVAVGARGVALYVNPRFQELFGIKVGEPITDLYANVADRAQMLDEVRQRGMVLDRVLEARSKDGRRLDVLCTFYPIEFDGEAATLGWTVDITQLKDTEKALEEAKHTAEAATRAKSTFLATMSHEIRTPMNAVLGYAQLFRRDRSLSMEQRQRVDAILSSGEHLLTLINNVLEMSRIEAGRSAVATEPVDLHALLTGIEQMFIGLARQKGLTLLFERGTELPQVIESDPGKIRQVIINLLSNATKFTKQGRIVVKASAELMSLRGLRITVSVNDSGAGIDADGLARIFSPFEQTAGGAQAGGTGLGLTIGRELARMMGGDLTATSTVGVGSTFTFVFAANLATGDTARTVAAGLPVGLAAGQAARKILIVDDARENREIVDELLRKIGFNTRIAESGEEAIVAHDDWHPDLVLMDLRMPGMGGIEAMRRLRAAGSPAVLVAFTASVLSDVEREALDAGANGVLRKPYREGELLHAIGEWLGVTYIHEDAQTASPAEVADAVNAVSLAQLLAGVPAPLLVQLREAIVQARTARIVTLAGDIAAHSPAAATQIRALVRDFRYEDLTAALDAAMAG